MELNQGRKNENNSNYHYEFGAYYWCQEEATTENFNEEFYNQGRDKDRMMALIRRINANCQKVVFAEASSPWNTIR